MKQFLECGKIVSTKGLKGEVRVVPWSDSADYLLGFATLYLDKGQTPLLVEAADVYKNMCILKIKGIDSLDDAIALRGKVLYINREDDFNRQDGTFFVQDLIGLRVEDADNGAVYGVLSDVFVTGANDVYEITNPDEKKLLIPAIKEVVIDTCIVQGVMKIRPLRGLFEDED